MTPLSSSHPTARYVFGDMAIVYVLDQRTHMVGLRMWPVAKEAAVVEPREFLDTLEILVLPPASQPVRAFHGETSLVQLKLAEDDSGAGFGTGRSMRQNPTMEGLRFVQQTVARQDGQTEIRTELRGARDFTCTHVLSHRPGDEAVRVHTVFTNTGAEPLTLEMLASFTLGHLSPFDAEDSAERLRVHRFRSLWSAEGRHEDRSIEELHLERSWASHSVVNERFGQVGSMPVRGFFPFVAIEDTREGVYWAAQLACPGSWQMEIYRRDDKVSLSGGLADREFGHWMKRIAPGESFASPEAYLTTSADHFDATCQRLTRLQDAPLADVPSLENELPIIFNEWCSSWGAPTPAFIAETASRLASTPCRIFVVDDGWADKPEGAMQFNGDWNVHTGRFPNGLAPVAQDLRNKGFVPGLWFEFEVCTEGTDAFALPDHKLRKDGRLLKVGTRHFWDFTDPWTFKYLTEKVIRRLKDDGFGYLKVDYNDCIGLGCDHPDSLGEGLRQHLAGVQEFFRLLRREMPELIIEVCASGGHRLEPSMLALGAQASFSDAHESQDIPIIAANLHWLMLPRQSQIWAVLHPSDSALRLQYSLAACFLGRLCLSGEIRELSEAQFALVTRNLDFYERVKPIIRDGESRIHRRMNDSYRQPRGWQAVTRTLRPAARECLVVVHAFQPAVDNTFEVPLPSGGAWRIAEHLAEGIELQGVLSGTLRGNILAPFSSAVIHLKAS